MALTFFQCQSCGNVAYMAINSGVTPNCCGEPMTELVANTIDASQEKHVPVVQLGTEEKMMKVCVGSTPHPTTEAHHINFICLETTCGVYFHYIKVGEPAVAYFRYQGKPIAVYEYCNLHGLWKSDIHENSSEVRDDWKVYDIQLSQSCIF